MSSVSETLTTAYSSKAKWIARRWWLMNKVTNWRFLSCLVQPVLFTHRSSRLCKPLQRTRDTHKVESSFHFCGFPFLLPHFLPHSGRYILEGNNLPKLPNERADKSRLGATERLPWDETSTDWDKSWSSFACLADSKRCSSCEWKHFTFVEEGVTTGKQNTTQQLAYGCCRERAWGACTHIFYPVHRTFITRRSYSREPWAQ